MSRAKIQRKIEWINDAQAIFDEQLLNLAVEWWAGNPLNRKKKISMHGKYPAVSIYAEKIHLHRLLASYIEGKHLPRKLYVHHKDGNKLNSSIDNLEVQTAEQHQRLTNKGRVQTLSHKVKRLNATAMTRYGHLIYENPELLK